jgi:trigger factor
MIAEKSIEPLEHSSVKLTVTVKNDSLKGEYQELLKKYSKTAHIKGFRKGKVPPSVLEKKFGESLRQEAAFNIMENALKEVFEEIEEKPLSYSQPELQDEELKPDLEKDFTFTVKYDVFPEVKLGEYKGLEIEVPNVSISKEDEERELKNLQEQNSMVVDKAEGSSVEKDDIITINYVELDEEGNEKEDTKREGFVFTVGSGYNIYKIDDDVLGMKKGEEKVVEKEFPEDYEYEELKGKKVSIKITVTAIKVKNLPALDDELAKDVSEDYETLEDLKKDIKKRLEDTKEDLLRRKKVEALTDKIIEITEVDPPESMVQAELENSWRSFVARSRAPEDQVLRILKAEGKTKEDVLNEWREEAVKGLKSQLALHKIMEQENIEIAENEVEEEIQKQAERSNMSVEDAKAQIEQNNLMEYITRELKDRKLIDFLLEESKIKKGPKMNFLDLSANN